MSTAVLTSLLEYLYGTLSPSNMRWVGEHLIEYAKKEEEPLKRYTYEEVNAMIDQAEAEIAEGKGIPHEEMMRQWEEEMAREEQELKMATAV
ncbi:MAG: hypothetical protein E7105_09535 [Prevotella sp.]|nr:hypothetical protein [Prevotella sp.]